MSYPRKKKDTSNPDQSKVRAVKVTKSCLSLDVHEVIVFHFFKTLFLESVTLNPTSRTQQGHQAFEHERKPRFL